MFLLPLSVFPQTKNTTRNSRNRQTSTSTATDIRYSYYPDGQLESISTYRKGKADGRAVSFFQNGRVGMKLNFKNGQLDGTVVSYNERGSVESTSVWSNGTKISERNGGRDVYIDAASGRDAFIDRHFRRKPVAKLSDEEAEQKRREQEEHNERIRQNNQPVPIPQVEVEQPQLPVIADNASTNTLQEETASNGKKVVIPTVQASENQEKIPKTNQQKPTKPSSASRQASSSVMPSFRALMELVRSADSRVYPIDALAGLARQYGMTTRTELPITGTMVEICFSRDMKYDEISGKDVVTGSRPRQLSFRGVKNGDMLTVQAINVYLQKEEDWRQMETDARSIGLEDPGRNKTYSPNDFILTTEDPLGVVATFLHHEEFYAGMYHLTIQTK